MKYFITCSCLLVLVLMDRFSFCRENVTVMCLVPYINLNLHSQYLVAAAKLAANDINKANYVLSNYELQIEFLDSKVTISTIIPFKVITKLTYENLNIETGSVISLLIFDRYLLILRF